MAVTDPAGFLRKRVMMAVATLLGVVPAASAKSTAKPTGPADTEPASPANSWTWETSFLRYAEVDRIKVLEPQIGVRRDFSGDRALNLLVTIDSITGATPLGTLPATANTAPNTVTSASGRGTNPVIGQIPLSNMTDTRVALDTSWEQRVGSDYNGIFGAYVSKETDFIAFAGNVKLARDFNQKNTTLSVGVAPEFDISQPNGGIPVPRFNAADPNGIATSQDERWLLSGLAGITQIINPRALMQFNYGLTVENGYLNDPYKLVSLVNAGGDPIGTIYENRPSHRVEQSFYWLTKYNLWKKDVFNLALRLYADDWGVHSHTLDFSYRRQTLERFYWEPHVRYYAQSAADFFRTGLLATQTLPADVSADMRLASMHGVTIGLRMGFTLKDGSQLIVRGEYYSQTGESKPKDAIGAQRAYDLFPTLYASIIQVDYRFMPAKWFGKKDLR